MPEPQRKPREVKIRVHDRVDIAVALYMPAGNGPFPVVLGASPYRYDNNALPATPQFLWRETGPVGLYVEHGYVYAQMDVRGCGKSGGEFRFLDRNEQKDLYDVIEWLGRQSWSNGKVGGIGQSYFCMLQWWMAIHKPPSLACIAAFDGLNDPYRASVYQGNRQRRLGDHRRAVDALLSAEQDRDRHDLSLGGASLGVDVAGDGRRVKLLSAHSRASGIRPNCPGRRFRGDERPTPFLLSYASHIHREGRYPIYTARGGNGDDMSAPFVVSIPHRLGKDEAVRRLKVGLGNASSNYQHLFAVEEEIWTGEHLQFRVRALGQVASGTIDVAEEYVTLQVFLPWLLAKIASAIQPLVRKEGTLLLEKK